MRSEVSFQLISFFFKIWGSIFVSYSFFLDKMSIIVGLLKKKCQKDHMVWQVEKRRKGPFTYLK
jgi:hypothetical protein